MRSSTRMWAVIAVLLCPSSSLAQSTPKPESRAAATPTSDPKAEVEALRAEGGPKAAAAIAAKVEAGLPAPALDVAIAALGTIGGPVATKSLEGLTKHRRAAVRRSALENLVRAKARSAPAFAEALLDDPSPEVRTAAVRAIESLGLDAMRRAAPQLERALEKGLAEAAPLLGKMARPNEVARWTGRLDAEGFERMSPALRIVLTRADLPAPTRTALVEKVGVLGSASAKQFLRDLATELPKGSAVRSAAQKALELDTAEAAKKTETAPKSEPPRAAQKENGR